MTRHEFSHSYDGQDTWIFQMDPVAGPKGLRYRVRAEKGTQWTDCVLRSAPPGASVDELKQAIIEWEARILRPTGTPQAPAA